MKKQYEQFDERQMQQYLRVNSISAWVTYGVLAAAILVQLACGGGFSAIVGEVVALFALCCCMLVGYFRYGLWDKTQHFSMKKNLLLSLAAAVAVGGAVTVNSYRGYHKLAGAVAAGIFAGGGTLLLCLLAIAVAWRFFQKKMQQLEQAAGEEEDTER